LETKKVTKQRTTNIMVLMISNTFEIWVSEEIRKNEPCDADTRHKKSV